MLLKDRVAVAVAVAVAAAVALAAEPGRATKPAQVLVAAGELTAARIVLPAEPHRLERLAGRDLQGYLRRITGVELPLVETDCAPAPGRPAIVVGSHPSNASLVAALAARFEIAGAGRRDAYVVDGAGEVLSLVGNGAAATYWAACDWLESLGVRWLFPHPDHGEFVPELDRVTIAQARRFSRAALALRGPRYDTPVASVVDPAHGLDAGDLFSLRLRLNENNPLLGPEGWVSLGSGHSYRQYLPPGELFDQHPSWFEMHAGVRVPRQVCYTNGAAADEFARRVVVELDALIADGYRLDRVRVAVSPSDGRVGCDCGECRRLHEEGGGATSMVVHFANAVARRVRVVHPEVQVYFYAYAGYAHPPTRTALDPNVSPEVSFWVAGESFRANHARPMTSPENAPYRDALRAWSAISRELSVYAYYGHYSWFTAWPMRTQIARDLPVLANDFQIYGLHSESHQHWGTQALNFHLAAALAWEPGRDPRALEADLLHHAFGSAATAIGACQDVLQARMDALEYVGGRLREVPALLTPAVVAACDREMANAAALAGRTEMDGSSRWRTELATGAWRASARLGSALSGLASSAPDRLAIADDLGAVADYAPSPSGRWAFEQAVVDSQLGPLIASVVAPLECLGPGRTSFDDRFELGGSLPLHAELTGLETGRWGYQLPACGVGRVVVPLRARAGHRIAALTARPRLTGEAWVRFFACGRNGACADMSPLGSDGAPRFAAGPAIVGGAAVDLVLEITNDAVEARTVLTGVELEVVVE